jgi:G:T-mismatch repair DNA endonuclease (very short patch repair protein)
VVTEQGREAWRIGSKKTHAKRKAKNNYRVTPEQRAKLSIATTKSLAGGKPYIVSKLEHKVAAELKTLGASFTAQYAFRDPLGRFACLVDFYFSELNAVLEVNGTYWHVDPRVYPEPINDMQRKCLAKYERKIKLLGDLGVRVVEVWEQDLNQDTPQAVLEAYLKLTKG